MLYARRRLRCAPQLSLAAAAGLGSCMIGSRSAHGQQNPYDQTVFLNASDSSSQSSFANGTNFQASSGNYAQLNPATNNYSNPAVLPAGSPPMAGYAYVDTGSAAGTGVLRTPTAAGANYTFGGDSLSILSFNGQANLYNTSAGTNAQDTSAALELYGPSGQAYTVNNLILGNGGAVINETGRPATLNGQITLLAAANQSVDGVPITVSGGIIDNNVSNGTFVINSTLVGSGQLRLISTHYISNSSITLNGSSGSFTGGVVADNSAGTSAAGTPLFININTPTALGTGTFTIQSINPTNGTQTSKALTIDNTTGATETLTTNNAQQWNGNFTFGGTNSLYMGSGTVTLGANDRVFVPTNVLAVGGVANPSGSSFTLTVDALSGPSNPNGVVIGGALEVPTLGSITSGLSVAPGGTLAFPATTNTPQQLAGYASTLVSQGELASNVYQSANIGIDTTGVTGGTYNLSTGLPTGNYGLNKVGAGTLVLTTASLYSGGTSITGGTLQFATNNPLPNTGFLDLGTSSTTAGTLDLNGAIASLPQPESSTGAVITNSNTSTPATVTFRSFNYGSHPVANFYGSITGNLSVVYSFTAPTASTNSSIYYPDQSTSTYTGTTNLQSGVISVFKLAALPTSTQGIFFAGGILNPSASNLDFSPGFSQAPGQQYAVAWQNPGIVTPFASSLNSSGGSLTIGSTNIYLDNSGTLVLSAANNYSGPTTVTSSMLQVANPKGLAGTSGVTVATTGSNPNISAYNSIIAGTLSINDSSGTVGLSGGVIGGAPITLSLNGLGSASTAFLKNAYYGFAFYGGLQGAAGVNAVWAGNVALSAAGAGISGGFNNASSGGTLAVTGVISGSGPLTLGLNANTTTVLAGANTYTGETQINCSTGSATTVQLGANNAIPAVSGLNFESNFAPIAYSIGEGTAFTLGTERFDLNRYSTSVAYLSNLNSARTTDDNYPINNNNFVTQATPAAITNSVANTTATLTIAGDPNGLFVASPSSYTAYPTFTGAIVETATSGKVAVVVNEAGYTQALSGASNYSGGTSVVGGTLLAQGVRTLSGTTLLTSSTGLGAVTVSGGGVLAGTGGTGPVVVAAGGTITAGAGTTGTPGTLSTSEQTWNASGAYLVKATSASTGDLLVMTGLTVGANSSSPFSVIAQGSGVSVGGNNGALLIATDTNITNPSGTNPFAAALAAKTLVLDVNDSTVATANGMPLTLLAGSDASGDYELYLTAAPEPASALLLAAATAPFALGRGRRRPIRA